VDDGSVDGTSQAALAAGARVVRHPYNIGNGAAVKTGIREARGEWLVFMDADGQHAPEDIPRLLAGLEEYDMVVGARVGRRGRPLHRRLANSVYNLLASYLTGLRIQDLTSGFRAIRRRVATKFIYLLPNGFSYPTTITLAVIKAGYSVKYEPIQVSPRLGKSKVRVLEDGFQFFLIILKIATLFSPFRIFFPISLFCLILGLGYGSYMIAVHHHFSNMILLLLITAILVFLLGLIAEEITMLRFERSEE